ncbi:hypothetical protein AAFF_G00168380 [Aldrovandia affinis]|uniref:Uncharacterized protein n=1 Tax=Aldrovandia affinis TaxID=143900 RepID=A0AAD7W716_9TELE|nr:hypothetical protein AAFF_G00168380 [Aldrovandia affinis]
MAVAFAQPTDVVKVSFQAEVRLADGAKRYNGWMPTGLSPGTRVSGESGKSCVYDHPLDSTGIGKENIFSFSLFNFLIYEFRRNLILRFSILTSLRKRIG